MNPGADAGKGGAPGVGALEKVLTFVPPAASVVEGTDVVQVGLLKNPIVGELDPKVTSVLACTGMTFPAASRLSIDERIEQRPAVNAWGAVLNTSREGAREIS